MFEGVRYDGGIDISLALAKCNMGPILFTVETSVNANHNRVIPWSCSGRSYKENPLELEDHKNLVEIEPDDV